MKSRILFLSDGSYSDAIAYAALCSVAQANHSTLTVVSVNSKRYHDEIRNEFSTGENVMFVASVSTYLDRLESWEMEACDYVFRTLHELCYKMNVPADIECGLHALDAPQDKYLPGDIAHRLFRMIGIIDFGNLVAHKLASDPYWDIVRDADVIDIVSPKYEREKVNV